MGQLLDTLSSPSSEIFNALDSLKRRMFLDLKQLDKKTLLLMNPIIKEYIARVNYQNSSSLSNK
jgi:hypothetical protein